MGVALAQRAECRVMDVGATCSGCCQPDCALSLCCYHAADVLAPCGCLDNTQQLREGGKGSRARRPWHLVLRFPPVFSNKHCQHLRGFRPAWPTPLPLPVLMAVAKLLEGTRPCNCFGSAQRQRNQNLAFPVDVLQRSKPANV